MGRLGGKIGGGECVIDSGGIDAPESMIRLTSQYNCASSSEVEKGYNEQLSTINLCMNDTIILNSAFETKD